MGVKDMSAELRMLLKPLLLKDPPQKSPQMDRDCY